MIVLHVMNVIIWLILAILGIFNEDDWFDIFKSFMIMAFFLVWVLEEINY